MTRRKNIPNKVAKQQRPCDWSKKLASLRKQYGDKVSKSEIKRAEQYAKDAGVSFHSALSDLVEVNGKKENTPHGCIVKARLGTGWMLGGERE
jgi:hypothetical protein